MQINTSNNELSEMLIKTISAFCKEEVRKLFFPEVSTCDKLERFEKYLIWEFTNISCVHHSINEKINLIEIIKKALLFSEISDTEEIPDDFSISLTEIFF